MPNSLTSTGLTIVTQSEVVGDYTTAFETIYGDSINLASDTPDGQIINIFAQGVLDIADVVMSVYNSFNPEYATGVVLDQRCAINGIVRQAGTYTVTSITLVLSQSVNLYGLDQTAQAPFTVSDSAGNQWVLETTELGVGPGTVSYPFQAAEPGATLTTPNTINVPVTVVLGVTSINNPTTYTTLGVNEESDIALRVRRAASVSLPSQGYLAGLIAALENVPGVTSAYVYENNTSTTDIHGIPGHSIWCIVGGSGAASAIANAIYVKRNAGCGMYGSQVYLITQVDGSSFPIYYDLVTETNLFVAFTVTSINGVTPPLIAQIIAGLPTAFVPAVNASVNINQLATYVQQIDPNSLVTGAGFSIAQTQIASLSGVAASGTFYLNYNGYTSAAIHWNDSVATIQTQMRMLAGLSAINVTGSIASQSLTFDLTSVGNVQGLIYVTTNTLQTAGSVPVTFSLNEGYANTLAPPSLKAQLELSSANIVILPMQMTPTTASLLPSATQTFTALGGYAPYTYSLSVNNSGGSINATSGVYTAGATSNVADTILVTDSFGNTATATALVT